MKDSSQIQFSLASHIYAAHTDCSVIILDVKKDKYLSLTGVPAEQLTFICKEIFIYEQGIYRCIDSPIKCDVSLLNYWISYYLSNDFISKSTQSLKKITPLPLKPGGLVGYQWDSKASWKPFRDAQRWEIFQTLITLRRVHRCAEKQGIGGILEKIYREVTKNQEKRQSMPYPIEIQRLSAAVDAASLIYPKKSFCLAWAATFTLRALKKQWPCQFVIGVQPNPFYAHAWAEISGKVIHDDPVVADVMSIILKT